MPIRYLDPTVDFVFKKIFGDKSHKEVTIDFLNTILENKGEHRIVAIDFNDTFNRKENKSDRLSIVDVRCTDQAGKTYIVEMQADFEPDFRQRCQYYVSCELSSQLDVKEPYGNITPVILVAVLDFTIFPEHNRVLTHHTVTDMYDNKSYLEDMGFHFIELKKFEKTENQLTNDIDRWIFFLKYAAKYCKSPEKVAKKNRAIVTAFQIVDQVNWSKQELATYERRVDVMRRQRSKITDALKKGRAKGAHEKARAVAKQLLTEGLQMNLIEKVTGLSEDEIKKIK